MNHPYSIVIHGGAGTLVKGLMSETLEKKYEQALQTALDAGAVILENKGTALDAVTAAVMCLENTPLFNAGKGAVYTHKGTHEMDAAIMDGSNLKAGAISLITGIKNPIALSREVMEYSDHVFLAGEGAIQFAIKQGYTLHPSDYFYDAVRYKQWQNIKDSPVFELDHSVKKDGKFGTVGAVALDVNGNVAAATSTGGMTNKKWGRIGDSPVIGAGTYANNNTCAISCTGSGEYFIRGVVAYDVSCLMEYKGLSLQEATQEVIHNKMPQLGGEGGLIAVDAKGEIAMPFNTKGMYRAFKKWTGETEIKMYKN